MNQARKNIQKKNSEIVAILNAPTLNELVSIKASQAPNRINPLLNDEATFELKTGLLFVENYLNQHCFKVCVMKMLDFLTIKLAEKNQYKVSEKKKINPNIQFSIEEYAILLGKVNPRSASTKKNVRRVINQTLDIIYNFSLETEEKRGAEIVRFKKMRICQSYECENSVFTFTFTEIFARYLLSAYIMQYPISLLKLDERNSNAYVIGRKLALHQSISNNIKKGTHKIISVESLLNIAPDIPNIETVRIGNGAWTERIADKLEKVLDLLVEHKIIEKWNYCNSKGLELSDEQLDNFGSYHIFKESKIKFSLYGLASFD
ncbi:hypothetical protein AB1I63_02515 [Streptococcus pneumoniae]